MVPDREADELPNKGTSGPTKKVVNFAALSAGAVVLEKSEGFQGTNSLLIDDKDKYGIAECASKKWLVTGLSEDILVKSIDMCNYEKYSSFMKEMQVRKHLSSFPFP
jgi:hypothetical protein